MPKSNQLAFLCRLTYKSKVLKLFLFSSFLLALLSPGLATAHPHNWINLKSEFVLDEHGRLEEIRQHWEFDVFYSMISMADLMNEHGDEEVGLKHLGNDMIKNLADHNFFSKLNIDGEFIPIPVPNQHRLSTELFKGQTLITLHMTFEFTDPLPIENKTLAWQVFDPTYFIDMSHQVDKQIIVHTQNATECAKYIEFAEPSDEMIDYASSLDRTQRNSDGLGILFAEKVVIQCV